MFYNKTIFKRCFYHPKKYWYKNIKNIPLYFKMIHHLVKHGYDEYATWETFDWFINTMKDILTYYRNHHQGYPVAYNFNEILQEDLEKEYDADLDKMISLLNDMDENNPKYERKEYQKDWKRHYEEMFAAKDKFFELFSKYFYNLWD